MYLFWKLYSDFIRYHLIIIVFLSLFLLLFNICFSHEAFAMEPSKDWVTDYYGNKQYIGPDAYGHFNKPGSSSNYPETERVQSDLGPPYSPQIGPSKSIALENDDGFISHNNNNSEFTLYLAIKRRTYWYIWKIHSTEYNNYGDFKRAWNPQSSFRKDFWNDLKNAFKRK
jgi:hypothetical protein